MMQKEHVIGRSIICLLLATMALVPKTARADGGDTNLIYVCVNRKGEMRIVSPTTTCGKRETPLQWPATARIVTVENRITSTEAKNSTQDSTISAIQAKNTQQDRAITALQSQTVGVEGGVEGLAVIDSQGQVVGKVFGNGTFRQLGNDSISFSVSPTGFVKDVIYFYHTTGNCSGTRYLWSYRAPAEWWTGVGGFTDPLVTSDGKTGYFASLPAQRLVIKAIEVVGIGQDASRGGDCQARSDVVYPVGVASSVDLLSLGVPPFHLE